MITKSVYFNHTMICHKLQYLHLSYSVTLTVIYYCFCHSRKGHRNVACEKRLSKCSGLNCDQIYYTQMRTNEVYWCSSSDRSTAPVMSHQHRGLHGCDAAPG